MMSRLRISMPHASASHDGCVDLSDFTVRAAHADDAGRIAEIGAACFSTPWSIEELESLVGSARSQVLVVECVGSAHRDRRTSDGLS
jgi:hypothetical protein